MEKTQAVKIALTFLEEHFKKETWTTGERLPSVHRLAHSAGVSATTMLKALGHLKSGKVVTLKKNVGYYRGDLQIVRPMNMLHTEAKPRWESIKQQLTGDIIEGKFEHSRLPSYKELSVQYGTGYGTLKKALCDLVNCKIVIPDKRGYRTFKSVQTKSQSTILLIQSENFIEFLSQSYLQAQFYTFLQTIGIECKQRNVLIQQYIYTGFSDPIDQFALALGFIIWIDPSWEKTLNTFLLFLEQFQKPIIIFNEEYDTPFIGVHKIYRNKYIHLFGLGNIRAGYAAGKFMLESGHKNICYLANAHTHWVDNRLDGIKKAFSLMDGQKTNLTSLVFSDCEKTMAFSDLLSLKDRSFQNILQKDLDTMHAFHLQISDKETKKLLMGRLWEPEYTLWYRYMFIALFRQALLIPDVTGWIVADDYLATFGALQFCKREHIKIPQQLSIISFNNMIEAFHDKLTSYDFNIPALTHRMLHILLDIPRKNAVNRQEIHEVDGFIAIRDSTKNQ